MKSRYAQLRDGEWTAPTRNGFLDVCCDCLLVHVVDYRVAEGGQIQFRASRDNRKTAALRRERANKIVKTAVKKMAQK